MSRLLRPLCVPYELAVQARNALYERGLLRPQRLCRLVVSIGNLSAGGSGKTPFTLELARLLGQYGVDADVLSRGYGRRSPVSVERVVTHNAKRFGDEPVLLFDAGLPVFVGASRYLAGLLAERETTLPDEALHLLDDGFQHRQLARDVDIVLMHPRDAKDTLLPAGRLREPLNALRRADFIVLREDDRTTQPVLEAMRIAAPVWRVRRTLDVPRLTCPAIAFAAIAHPQEFFSQLRLAGIALAHTFAFRDHHRLTGREIERIRVAAGDRYAVVTTKKDLARMGTDLAPLVGRAAGLYQAVLRTELLDAPRCLLALRALLQRRRMRK